MLHGLSKRVGGAEDTALGIKGEVAAQRRPLDGAGHGHARNPNRTDRGVLPLDPGDRYLLAIDDVGSEQGASSGKSTDRHGAGVGPNCTKHRPRLKLAGAPFGR